MRLVLLTLCLLTLKAQAHPIQLLITNPRSVSTAFERSMMQRGDHKIFHEPWGTVYIHNLGLLPTAPQELLDAKNYQGVKELVYSYAEHQPVFIKDMIWIMQDDLFADEAFLKDENVIVTILIRDPALCIESFFLQIKKNLSTEKALEVTELVMRFDQLVHLAEKYQKLRGKWPIIIESETLCAKPEETVKSFCDQAQITFLPHALKWDTLQESPEEWKHTSRWHEDAAKSKGFVQAEKKEERFSKCPEVADALEKIYQTQKPFYEKLKEIL